MMELNHTQREEYAARATSQYLMNSTKQQSFCTICGVSGQRMGRKKFILCFDFSPESSIMQILCPDYTLLLEKRA